MSAPEVDLAPSAEPRPEITQGYVGRHRAVEGGRHRRLDDAAVELDPLTASADLTAVARAVTTPPTAQTDVKDPVRRNVMWNLATGPGILVGNLLLVAFAIAVAGAYQYGVWAVAFGAATLFAQADFGVGTALIRQLASLRAAGELEQERSCRLYGLLLCLGIGLAMGLLLGGGLSVYFHFNHPAGVNASLMVSLSAGCMPIIFVGRFFLAIVQSHQRFLPERVIGLFSLILRASILGVGYTQSRSVVVVAISDSVGLLAIAVGGYIAARFWHDTSLRGARRDPAMFRALTVFGLKSFVSNFASIAALQAPLYFVGSIVGYTDAAVFSAVMRFALTSRIVFSWVTGPFLPSVAVQSIDGDRTKIQLQYDRAVIALGLLNALYVIVMVTAGGQLLSMWLGASYARYGDFVAIVGLSILVSALYAPGVVFATALGFPSVIAIQAVITCVATLVLAGVLPAHFGVVGGGLAVLLPLLVVVPVGQRAIRRKTTLEWSAPFAFVCAVSGIGALASIGALAGLSELHPADNVILEVGAAGVGALIGVVVSGAAGYRPYFRYRSRRVDYRSRLRLAGTPA